MSKIFAWVASILLIVSLGGLIYFAIQNQQNNKLLENTNTNLQEVSDELEQKQSQLSQAETTLNETQKALEEEKAKNSKLEKDYNDKNSLLTEARSELNNVKPKLDKLLCPKQFGEMDYSSIINASERLQYYVSTLPDVVQVSSTMRNTLWNNADSKVHVITYKFTDGQFYSMQFLVYMDEFDWARGTFYVDGQCWIDPPY
jgi:hypothetical protein